MDIPFRTDDEAATSVIGVVIMVAIAVILAGLIGQFMFDLVGERQKDNAPTAKFTYAVGDCGGITVTHNRGPAVDGTNLRFGGAAQEYTSFGSIPGWNGSDVDAGDSVTVDATPGEELTMVWASGSDDSTSVIPRYEVPSGSDSRKIDLDVEITELEAGGDDRIEFDIKNYPSYVDNVYAVASSSTFSDQKTASIELSADPYSVGFNVEGNSDLSGVDETFKFPSGGNGPFPEPGSATVTVTIYRKSDTNCQLGSDQRTGSF